MKQSYKFYLILFLFSQITLYSQPTNEWFKYIEGLSSNNGGYSLCSDGNGNVYSTGKLFNEIYVSKYNATGSLIWQKLYNGNINDAVDKILLAPDGNIVVLGTALVSSNIDMFLYKLSPLGDSIWFSNFNASGTHADYSETMLIDQSGNIYAIGTSMTPSGYNYTTIKYGNNGNLLWYKNYNGAMNGNDISFGLHLDNSNNVYVVGNAYENNSGYTVTTIKYDNSGGLIWSKVIDSLFVYKYCSGMDNNSNIYIAGVNNEFKSRTVKLNSNGNINWIKNDTSSRGEPRILVATNGTSFVTSRNYDFASEDIRTTCINTNGNVVWTSVFGTITYEELPIKIVGESANNILILARIDGISGFLKYTINGQLLWVYRDTIRTGVAKDITVDQNNNILVTGRCSFGNSNIFTAKYSQVIGIHPISNEIPKSYSLSQNFPNPFNPSTKIRFELPNAGNVKITMFDALGKEVKLLVNENLQAGVYETDFEASLYPSGVYFYRLQSGSFNQSKKMILIK